MEPFIIILAEKELKIIPLDNGNYDVYSGRRNLCTIWPDEYLEWDDGQVWLALGDIDPHLLRKIGKLIEDYHDNHDE
jgi:hypothetical protein